MPKELQKISTILYVEDESGIREELSDFLEDFCEKLYVGENGAIGLELYKKYSPKIIITDIKMPVMDGLSMAKQIKSIDDDAKIIFTTAFSDPEYMQKAIEIQASGYVLKPIDLSILETMIQKVMDLSKLKDDLYKQTNTINEYLKIIDENVLTSSTDLNANITSVSEAFCRVSGYSKSELLQSKHSLMRHENMSKDFYKKMWESLLADKTWQGEIKNRKKDGSSYWMKTKIYPIYNDTNEKIGYTAINEDITNLKKVQELSIRDGLTNIHNRRYFNEAFPSFIQIAKRTNDLVCLAILDIDHFKQYNDTYGHQKGDDALIDVANAMKKVLNRADDKLFRLGGEEFGILFKSSTKENALELINRVIKAVYDIKIPHKSSSVCKYLTISAGLQMEFAKSIKDENIMYKNADDLLYMAKESGRNRVVAYTQENK